MDLIIDTSDRASGKPVVSVGDAEGELLHRLSSGQLTAYAVSIADRSPIPEYAWIDVRLAEVHRHFSCEPRVRSAEVLSLWQAIDQGRGKRRLPRRPRVQRDAALAVLSEIYPETGGDPGSARRKEVLRCVNEGLRKRGEHPVGRDTLRRAINEICAGR